MDAARRISALEATLARFFGLIAAADSKITTILAIDTAMLGVVAALVPKPSGWTNAAGIFGIIASALLLSSLAALSFCAFPRLAGPHDSVVFFGSIGGKTAKTYQVEVAGLSESDYLRDLAAECYYNARIAELKFKWIRRSMMALYLALLPWLAAVHFLYHIQG